MAQNTIWFDFFISNLQIHHVLIEIGFGFFLTIYNSFLCICCFFYILTHHFCGKLISFPKFISFYLNLTNVKLSSPIGRYRTKFLCWNDFSACLIDRYVRIYKSIRAEHCVIFLKLRGRLKTYSKCDVRFARY